MIKRTLLVIAAAVVALLGYAAGKPNDFRVARTVRIAAPPAKIVPLIDDFQRWRAWSPYEKRDPGMQRTFSGPTSGTGAVYAWAGNRDVGSGRMEILATSPERVTIELDFLAPFEGHNTAIFAMDPRGDATDVTWSMHGPRPFVAKLIGVFLDMDRMIGADFEAGLADLKALAEA